MSQDLSALNKQAIASAKGYMGQVAWPTVLLVAAVLPGYALNLALFASGVFPVWVALPCLGALTYMSYTPLHEAVHGNIHGTNEGLRWLNDLCGYLMAPLIAIPCASHRYEHLTHHRFTNQPGKASSKDRVIYCLELFFSLSWRVAFVSAVVHSGAASLLEAVGVIVLGYLLGGYFTAYWFAYRPHIPYQDAKRYRNTSSLIMPTWMKPLEWFWLGQNLHSIHHLFPRVPFYKYHALHRDIEPIMRAQGAPIIGAFNRKPL
jgi:beta-carotene hydroxylase